MGPPLLSWGAFLACLLLLQTGDDVVVAQTEMDGNQIVGVAAAGNTIHAEQFLDFSSLPYPATIKVVSDVPVTVERYYDSGYYLDGQQPRKCVYFVHFYFLEDNKPSLISSPSSMSYTKSSHLHGQGVGNQ